MCYFCKKAFDTKYNDDYGKKSERGPAPPPQLLRTDTPIPDRRRTDRRNRAFCRETRSLGIQLAVGTPRAAAARTPQGILGVGEANAASHRPGKAFAATEKKIDGSFASGYGTVLYFEDTEIVKGLQKQFPLYADNFPVWSEHTSAMHQLAVWTMLEDAGFGASLQHYNPLIDNEVREHWGLPGQWRLIAQMPFGIPAGEPQEKSFEPLDDRLRVFK